MMRGNKKGMTMALTIVIAIVVLIVIALAVITITSGSLGNFGRTTDEAAGRAGDSISGSASCSGCAFVHTKATVSKIDDVTYTLPVFCETAAGVKYCCTGSNTQCKPIATCTATDAAANVVWTVCVPVV